MRKFSLDGKNILVTGASSGIGRQCAIGCSQMGARVILTGRNQDRLWETLELMENKGNHFLFPADITEFEKIEELVTNIVSEHGKLNGVVNCAGISTTLPFTLAKPGKIEEYFRVNVQAAFNVTRCAVKQSNFSENGGSIIFISSVMGEVGEVGKTIYSITKGAVAGGARSLSLELAPRKIRVNCISPGVVESPMSENAIYSRSDEALEKIKGLHPLGLGKPDDVANACVFLLSDEARWITGSNLKLDGGYTAR